MSKLTTHFVALALGCLLGWSAHWRLTEPQAVQLVSTPAQRLAHGGLQAESRIDPEAKPKQALPLGAKARHVGHATIKPISRAGRQGRTGMGVPDARDGAKDGRAPLPGCGPVRLDYTLYQGEGGQEFMRLSSPDGEIADGVDSIVTGLKLAPDRSWAVGAGRGPDGRYGVRVDRDFKFAPLRVGVDLQQGQDHRLEPWLWLTLRF